MVLFVGYKRVRGQLVFVGRHYKLSDGTIITSLDDLPVEQIETEVASPVVQYMLKRRSHDILLDGRIC